MDVNILFKENPTVLDIDAIYINPEFDFEAIPPINKYQVEHLCFNPRLTHDYIKIHPRFAWNWEMLLCRKLVTPEDLEYWRIPYDRACKKVIKLLDHNIDHETIINILTNLPKSRWSMIMIYGNINVERFIHTFIKMGNNCNYWWKQLSKNKNVTSEILLKYPNCPWHRRKLSGRISIQMIIDDVNRCRFPWDWDRISANVKKEEYFKYRNHPTCKWAIELLAINSNFTLSDLKELGLLKQEFVKNLSANRNISVSFILKHRNWSWNRYRLSVSGNTDVEIRY